MSWIYLHKLADVIPAVTSFRPLFSFIINSIKRDWVRKKKNKFDFLRVFDNLFQNIVFLE